ncbi:D-3-phosphoglycerate dehydrogenase [Denitrovibrio acetiphilus DSM 12809]|uniref:D-3-phosphoglycerate dehydrogenase n=1 Tax=Denitrovibrio acetiphilus (strain DSM 12809 / NBRC 114555 / N2460) TaxID=522772 RepID=D4H7N3_DENA2|nr:phosphoglycerate dehydrogenase [Denitrovibrio acetiphilus]ADD68032.1 D-3-phosphoglycerate dehydrogenase [Denitrovibrio acetiphilus DSM 12809]
MPKYKVLITDHISQDGVNILKSDKDIEVDIQAGIKNPDLKKIIGNYDAIITRSGTTVTAELIENPGKLKIIGRAGVGLDNVDIEAASMKGIIVMNAPTGNTLAACELTMGMMLSVVRKLPLANQVTKSGEWDRKRFMGIQLYQKTLAVVGLGRIGGNVAKRCKAFDMKVVAYDPYIKKSRAESLGVELCNSLEEAISQADIITFHTPLTDETKNLITKDEIAKMKDGVVIINCARGGIVNELDLVDACKSGKVTAAGLDVFMSEPPVNHPFFDVENIYVTPHIGANTAEGQYGVAVIIAEQVVNALHGRSYKNAVNIPFMKTQLPEDMQKYFELLENIGHMAAQLTKGRPERIEIQMVGHKFEEDFGERTFDTPFNFQPFTVAGLKGFMEVAVAENVSFINAPYVAKERNIDIIETKSAHYDKYNDLVMVKVKTDVEEKIYAGTVFADQTGRIVIYDKYYTDLIAEGTFLYFNNLDRPGIIGKVGTILGKHSINIADFDLARNVKEDGEADAVAFVRVDSKVPAGVLDEILALDGMLEAKVITF